MMINACIWIAGTIWLSFRYGTTRWSWWTPTTTWWCGSRALRRWTNADGPPRLIRASIAIIMCVSLWWTSLTTAYSCVARSQADRNAHGGAAIKSRMCWTRLMAWASVRRVLTRVLPTWASPMEIIILPPALTIPSMASSRTTWSIAASDPRPRFALISSTRIGSMSPRLLLRSRSAPMFTFSFAKLPLSTWTVARYKSIRIKMYNKKICILYLFFLLENLFESGASLQIWPRRR